MAEKLKLPLVGALTAVVSLALVMLGNPANMGFCIACFLRDTAGALGLHGAAVVQYARPEILGIVFGALIVSMATKEFAVKGGSAPVTRFVLGGCVMIGALIFLGCPLRMVLRIAGGDLNAVVGLLGFAAGILCGVLFLNKGFTLGRSHTIARMDGFALPVMCLLVLAALLFAPALLKFSESGPGSLHAPLAVALVAGLVMGAVGYLSRLCFVAGIRDSVLFKNFGMLLAFASIVVVGIIGNVATGRFNLGFTGQPVAHADSLWNFLGLFPVGLGSVLLGGCPFRQLVLAGSGNSDSAVAVGGMVFGAALAHNLGLASAAAGADSAGGPTANGKVAFVIVMIILLDIAVYNTWFAKKAKAEAPA